MKKLTLLLASGLAFSLTLCGCSGKSETKTPKTKTAEEKTDTASEAAASDSADTGNAITEATDAEVSEADAAPDPSTEADTTSGSAAITGYLVDSAAQYITLGNFDGIDVERPVYEVSDEEVLTQMENACYEMAQVKTVTREARLEDTVTADLKATIQGEEEAYIDETDYPIQLGYEEFGAEFDNQLTGVKTGDTRSFSCTFDEETWYEDWVGQTVDFEVTVKQIDETIIPELNDDFVTKTLGYESMEVYEAEVRNSITESYQQQSIDETKENALIAAMSVCSFNGYPDKLYDTCQAAVKDDYTAFAENFGMTLEELLEAYDMSEEDLDLEVENTVNRRLFVSAICEQEMISLTGSEYQAFVDEQYLAYGFEDAETFEAIYGKEYLLWTMYESKVGDYLLEHVKPYDVPVNPYEDLGFEEYLEDDSEDGTAADDVEEIAGLEEDGVNDIAISLETDADDAEEADTPEELDIGELET